MASSTAAATPKCDISTHRAQGALDRELYCPRLERLLMGSASELGHRGNLAQVVASIERGGAGGGGEDPNLGMLRRLGATDTRGIDNRVQQLRELEQSFGQLSREYQARALAHYLGTPRAHATLRERFGKGQGGLAGVVLYRWQQKQDKARARGVAVGSAKAVEQLERVRAELTLLERQVATLSAVLDTPLPLVDEPRPVRPEDPEPPPFVLRGSVRDRQLQEYWAPYRAAYQAWAQRDDVRALRAAQVARRGAAQRQAELVPLLPPLRAQRDRLCAELADVASVTADDEEALVRLCRSGNLDAPAHLAPAEADVRALHRAWQLVSRKADKQRAKSWVDEGATV